MDSIMNTIKGTGAAIEDKTTKPAQPDIMTRATQAAGDAQTAVTNQTSKIGPAVTGAATAVTDSVKQAGDFVQQKYTEATTPAPKPVEEKAAGVAGALKGVFGK